MTPRSLIIAIGATALDFAVAIGLAAESTTDLAVEPASVVAAAQQSNGKGAMRLAVWNDPCVIAV